MASIGDYRATLCRHCDMVLYSMYYDSVITCQVVRPYSKLLYSDMLSEGEYPSVPFYKCPKCQRLQRPSEEGWDVDGHHAYQNRVPTVGDPIKFLNLEELQELLTWDLSQEEEETVRRACWIQARLFGVHGDFEKDNFKQLRRNAKGFSAIEFVELLRSFGQFDDAKYYLYDHLGDVVSEEINTKSPTRYRPGEPFFNIHEFKTLWVKRIEDKIVAKDTRRYVLDKRWLY